MNLQPLANNYSIQFPWGMDQGCLCRIWRKATGNRLKMGVSGVDGCPCTGENFWHFSHFLAKDATSSLRNG